MCAGFNESGRSGVSPQDLVSKSPEERIQERWLQYQRDCGVANSYTEDDWERISELEGAEAVEEVDKLKVLRDSLMSSFIVLDREVGLFSEDDKEVLNSLNETLQQGFYLKVGEVLRGLKPLVSEHIKEEDRKNRRSGKTRRGRRGGKRHRLPRKKEEEQG